MLLSNWWSSFTSNYSDDRVTSFWLPAVSSILGERVGGGPQDLLKESIVERSHALEREHGTCIVGYQQRNCGDDDNDGLAWAERKHLTPSLITTLCLQRILTLTPRNQAEKREQLWDSINEALLREFNTTSFALGHCNGFKKLGRVINFTTRMVHEL